MEIRVTDAEQVAKFLEDLAGKFRRGEYRLVRPPALSRERIEAAPQDRLRVSVPSPFVDLTLSFDPGTK